MESGNRGQFLLVVVVLILATSLRVVDALSGISMSLKTKHKLYDLPVSNNGARCRIIVYKKDLPESEVQIVSPLELGGLKSPEYLKLNPQGKMPTMTAIQTNLHLPESDTICRYLMVTYAGIGPSFQPDNPKSNLIARLHDIYLTTIQGCLYKATPPFGVFATRKDAIAEFRRQLLVIEDLVQGNARYLCGNEVSLADATVFPTMVFANFMLPKFDVVKPLPPKIEKWYNSMIESDPDFRRVYEEILGGLQNWDIKQRWDTIWLAGARDEQPPTVFDKVISREAPADVVYEDSKTIAFKALAPAAPAHVLVIPKDRSGLVSLRNGSPEHLEILGRLMVAAGEVAKDKKLGFGDGARYVINDGKDGGQEISHLHVHVLGGRQMEWPPG